MKRLLILTLALLLAILPLAPAARAEAEDPFVGLWEMKAHREGGVYYDYGYMEPVLRGYMDFLPSGAIYCVMSDGQTVNEDYMAYAVTGETTLALYQGSNRLTGQYDPAAKALTVTEPESGFVLYLVRAEADLLPDLRAWKDRRGEARTYCGYCMTQGDRTVDLLTEMLSGGKDPRDISLTLEADGTGSLRSGGEARESDITWTEDRLIAGGASVGYTRQGDHILVDLSGEGTILEFAPRGEVEALLLLREAVVADALAGRWQIAGAVLGERTLTAQQIKALGLDMSYEFLSDGTASLTSNGVVVDGLAWSVGGSGVVLKKLGSQLYTLRYEDGYLILDADGALYFEKAD